MKRKFFWQRAVGLCLLMFLTILLACPVEALSSAIDLGATASLTLKEISSNTSQPLAGLDLTIYRVAAFSDSNGSSFKLTSNYSSCGIDVNDISTSEKQTAAASTAMAYINAKSIAGITCKSDSSGIAAFNNLQVGLYLVRITSSDANIKVASGLFFVSLPMANSDGTWQYHVVGQPKSIFSTSDGETHTVRKIWSDTGYENNRPAEIKVGLYRSGVLVDTVTLNKLNDWSYVWSGLSDGFTWTAKELTVPTGYTSLTENTGTITTITNTYLGGVTIPDDDVPLAAFPQTGQNVIGMFVCLTGGLILLIFGFFELIVDWRKKRHE